MSPLKTCDPVLFRHAKLNVDGYWFIPKPNPSPTLSRSKRGIRVLPMSARSTNSFDHRVFQERIVNGFAAERNEYCWQGALMNSTGMIGSATLIHREWVVTAAHKISERFIDSFIVVLGEYDFENADSDTKVFYATPLQVVLHPGFNPKTYENDIALIRIPPVPCQNRNICTLCLGEHAITFPKSLTSVTTEAPATTTNRRFFGRSPTIPNKIPTWGELEASSINPNRIYNHIFKIIKKQRSSYSKSSRGKGLDENGVYNYNP